MDDLSDVPCRRCYSVVADAPGGREPSPSGCVPGRAERSQASRRAFESSDRRSHAALRLHRLHQTRSTDRRAAPARSRRVGFGQPVAEEMSRRWSSWRVDPRRSRRSRSSRRRRGSSPPRQTTPRVDRNSAGRGTRRASPSVPSLLRAGLPPSTVSLLCHASIGVPRAIVRTFGAVGTRAVGTRAVGTRAVGTRAVGTWALSEGSVRTASRW